jgi:putative flippase GtrA
MAVHMAKAKGFLVATFLAYFTDRFWTFGDKPHALGSV